MKIISLLVLISNILFALDITKAEDVVERGELVYKKFEKEPFTGLGKLKIEDDKISCGYLILVAEVENGKPEGELEKWTCDGKLLAIQTYLNNKKTFVESWDKQGKKVSSLSYSKEGKPLNGFEKYGNLSDLTYKNGLKSGHEIDHSEDYSETYKVYYEDGKVTKKVKMK